MKSSAEASACAKLILFGEHSVVYGYPAIAVPLTSLRLSITVQAARKDSVKAPGLVAADRQKLLESLSVARQQMRLSKAPLLITVSSQIPFRAGLGSSAAFSVALVRALARLTGKKLAAATVSQFAYELEKIYHGTPSGIDTTVSANEKPIFFIKGKPPQFIRLGSPLPLIIANSGSHVATKKVVADVRQRMENNPRQHAILFEKIGSIAMHARGFLEQGELVMVGKLMSLNQELLMELGVSSPALDRLVAKAHAHGALGAKLSGAGRGGCIVALAQRGTARKIFKALRLHGTEAFSVAVK